MINHYLRLEDLVFPPPVPALIAVLMVLGLKNLGDRLFGSERRSGSIIAAMAFILATSGVAALANLLALAGLANLWLLRTRAWLILLLGVLELINLARRPAATFRQMEAVFKEQSLWGKAALVLLALTAFCLLLSVLGPPTDVDSLDYHLGVPLEILRQHGAYARPDWLHARLTGLGEALNMLGLAGGSDTFGAALQFAGLIALLAAITSLGKTDFDKILLAMCVLGCPVVFFLVPSQKPQMLPTAAMVLALILLAPRRQPVDPFMILLSFGGVFFAMSCKYSFILPGSIVVAFGLILSYRGKCCGRALGLALAGFMILVFPVYLRNYLFYGDPLSPFLERFRTEGNLAVIQFASYLRAYSDSGSNALPFPLGAIFPFSSTRLTKELGLAPWLLLVALRDARNNRFPRILLVVSFLTFLLAMALSQKCARFFLEPYFWIIAAAAASTWIMAKRLFFKLMVGQMLIISLIAGFGAITLFPGALTASLRNSVMTWGSGDYASTQWLKDVLPADTVAVTDIRSSALMPCPSYGRDILHLCDLRSQKEFNSFLSMLQANQVNTFITNFSLPDGIPPILGAAIAAKVAGPQEVPHGSRYSWKMGRPAKLVVYRLNLDKIRPMEGNNP